MSDLFNMITARGPLIMGILNITPDSFSDGGRYSDVDMAVASALTMVRHGAAIIDIGGESTRPGSDRVPAQQQIDRVVPVIAALRAVSDVHISVDTTKAAVARTALKAGATIINDISALEEDPAMALLAAEFNCPLILMHKQGTPADMQDDPHYNDPVQDIIAYLSSRIDWACQHGIERGNIILDPGIGFGKTLEHNLQIIANFEQFKQLNCPLLLGASRKSFIGKILNIDIPSERIYGDSAVTAWAIEHGADIVRVHEVKPAADIIAMNRAIRMQLRKLL